ncbi:unnamed protein product [Arabis nemorensis]|uniref:Uncharacterized protein n=1 Tax=Arabis nemorensis TaxID=586526 RepID=A0A565BEY8_9BRAS|nr:unnamed protein product [Arabis nemorensis]
MTLDVSPEGGDKIGELRTSVRDSISEDNSGGDGVAAILGELSNTVMSTFDNGEETSESIVLCSGIGDSESQDSGCESIGESTTGI